MAAPWLAGHGALYAAAAALSKIRARARVALSRRQLASLAKGEEELLRVFHSFDTSGDGELDAAELKVALCFFEFFLAPR